MFQMVTLVSRIAQRIWVAATSGGLRLAGHRTWGREGEVKVRLESEVNRLSFRNWVEEGFDNETVVWC